MNILATTSLESNKRMKINFDGGDLSSDAGLLLIKEFAAKTGLTLLIEKLFKTNGTTRRQYHKDSENLLQMIFQIIAGYFEDDCADELTNEPVFTEILQKSHLASQPTISRFWNRMDETTLEQLNEIGARMQMLHSTEQPPITRSIMLSPMESSNIRQDPGQLREELSSKSKSRQIRSSGSTVVAATWRTASRSLTIMPSNPQAGLFYRIFRTSCI